MRRAAKPFENRSTQIHSYIAGAVLLLAVIIGTPARGDDLKNLLSGKDFPLETRLRDLNGDWREFAVSGQFETGNLGQAINLFLGGGSGQYYSKGQTVVVGNETYLVAYRAQPRQIDLSKMMSSSKPPEPEPMTMDTPLALSLLNLRTIGSVTDIHPFDPAETQQTMAGVEAAIVAARARAKYAQSVNNLKQLALGLIQYTQDYDEKFPPMKTAATLKKAIEPYIKSEIVFINPITGKPYQPNPWLSGKTLAVIEFPSEMASIFEDSPGPDGMRAIAFIDGHVRRLPEEQWPAIKRKSKIP